MRNITQSMPLFEIGNELNLVRIPPTRFVLEQRAGSFLPKPRLGKTSAMARGDQQRKAGSSLYLTALSGNASTVETDFIGSGESSSIRPRKQAPSYQRATRRVMPDRIKGDGLAPRNRQLAGLNLVLVGREGVAFTKKQGVKKVILLKQSS